jgi:hypothetical protein
LTRRIGSSAALAAIAALLLVAHVAIAQQPPAPKYPIFTADHLDNAMKTVGLAYGLTRSAIEKKDTPNAKDYLVRARDQLATTITFWRDRKREDAIAILRETLKKMDALDAEMSVEAVNLPAVSALAASVGASCDACHTKYREQDPGTKAFRVRAEALR